MKKTIAIVILTFFLGVSVQANNCVKYNNVFFSSHDTLSIKVPNVFTPNGDGVNDAWSIVIHDYGIALLDLQTTVYDRWGEQVFQSTNINQAWLGHTSTGRLCSDGSYFYVISYTNGLTGKQETYTGFVQLLR